MIVARSIRGTAVLLAAVLLLLDIARAPARDHQAGKPGGGPSRVFVIDGSPVHNVGNLRVHAPNWGMFGSWPRYNLPFSNAPSAEWPAGSRVEYLFSAGLWVGALLDGTPAVSTSLPQWEFRPSPDPGDIVYRAVQGDTGGVRIPLPGADDDHDGLLDEDWPDGYDNDFDRFADEDYAAISDQMFSRRFRDDTPGVLDIYPDHRPMHLAVREESYQWRNTNYDDFVGFTFWISNDGADTLRSVYIGVFADGDVGSRSRNNNYTDDATGFDTVMVDHTVGTDTYDFAYWYDLDGDNGQAQGYAGLVVLDHPTDPLGIDAPPAVGPTTVVSMLSALAYGQGGPPTNDFERYELMSAGSVSRNRTGDVNTLVAVGPFAHLYPGETTTFTFALVVTPRDDFTNVRRVAVAWYGRWFDLDGDPLTGIGGREHQEHWYLPAEEFQTVAFESVGAEATEGVVEVKADIQTGLPVKAINVYRGHGDGSGALDLVATLSDCGCGGVRYIDRGVVSGGSYRYQIGVVDGEGEHMSPQATATASTGTATLAQNQPNPFNPVTTIHLSVPANESASLVVYDVSGRRVRTLVQGTLSRGPHDIDWDGLDDAGNPVASGVYFYRLDAGGFVSTRKMMLLK